MQHRGNERCTALQAGHEGRKQLARPPDCWATEGRALRRLLFRCSAGLPILGAWSRFPPNRLHSLPKASSLSH